MHLGLGALPAGRSILVRSLNVLHFAQHLSLLNNSLHTTA